MYTKPHGRSFNTHTASYVAATTNAASSRQAAAVVTYGCRATQRTARAQRVGGRARMGSQFK